VGRGRNHRATQEDFAPTPSRAAHDYGVALQARTKFS
jgi:hypothetical protein